MRLFIILFCCILLQLQTLGQPIWKNITDTRTVSKIIPNGQLTWLSSDGGLMCINSASADTLFYNRANSGLPFVKITDMEVDQQGRLWLTNGSAGIACKEGDTWISYSMANSPLPNNCAVSIRFDSHNGLWAGFRDHLVNYDGTNWTVYPMDIYSGSSFYPVCMSIDTLNRILMGANGILMFDGIQTRQYDIDNSPILSNHINYIKCFPSGKTWIGHTEGGLTITDFVTWEVYDTLVPGKALVDVTSFDCSEEGKCWLGTRSGDLYYYDGSEWSLQYPQPSADSLDNIRYIALDSTEKLYVAANSSYMFSDGQWETINTANSDFKGNQAWNIFHSSDRSTWVANAFGAWKYQTNTDTWLNYPVDNFGNETPSCFAEDQSRQLHFASGNRIYYLENGSWIPLIIPDDPLFTYSPVTQMCFDTSNVLWYLQDPGLVRFDGTNATYYTIFYNNFPADAANCLALSSDGHILAGTNDGLVIQNSNGWEHYSTNNSPLCNGRINDISVYGDEIWMGTFGGLSMFDGLHWENYEPMVSGLPHGYIPSLDIDSAGMIRMLSGTEYLVEFDRTTWQIISYVESALLDGVRTDLNIDDSGNTWIGGINCGITIYNDKGITLDIPTNTYSFKETMQLFPNPCKDKGYVRYSFPEDESGWSIVITDILGQEMLNEHLQNNNGFLEIDVSRYNSGMYMISLRNRTGAAVSSKMIVQ